MTAGQLVQFIFYAGIVAGGVGALSETYGDLQRAAGASERLSELLTVEPEVKAPVHPVAIGQDAGPRAWVRDACTRIWAQGILPTRKR